MLDAAPPQLSLWSDEDSAQGWAVRESRRARRLAVRIFPNGGVEVVVPRRTSRRAVAEFLDGHRAWIESKLAQARRGATSSRLSLFLPAGSSLPPAGRAGGCIWPAAVPRCAPAPSPPASSASS